MSTSHHLPRRRFLGIAAGSVAAAPFALTGLASAVFPPVARATASKKISLAWNTGAICGAPIAAARDAGIFERHGLDVEFINFAGSTEQLLESLATGNADAAVGMALRWLKPLEQGFDVKIVAGLHSGCLRLLAGRGGGIEKIEDLRGKTVAIADLSSPSKHFFAIQLAKRGIDPEAEVDWRVFPGELLGSVVERGEAAAIAHWDPLTYQFLKSDSFVEIASNMDGVYASRACCVVGVRQSLIRDNPEVVEALVRATTEGHHYAADNPRAAAEAYRPYSPNTAIEDLEAQVRYHGHHHAPSGDALKRELAEYTADLKQIGVIRDRTDPDAFAEQIYSPVAI